MKTRFISAFMALYGASKRQARRAWREYPEALRIAIIDA